MKKIEIEIPEGKKAEWVDGVLTLVDDKPIESKRIGFKFNIGDKVKITVLNSYPQDTIFEIVKQNKFLGEPLYDLKHNDAVFSAYERYLELAFEGDITERIKTLADACEWCKDNGKANLVEQLDAISETLLSDDAADILAYLELRIITAALNEGWEPTYEMGEYGELDENIFVPDFGDKEVPVIRITSIYGDSSTKLCFKSEDLAAYAAKQFRDIYADFCGCGKGGEK